MIGPETERAAQDDAEVLGPSPRAVGLTFGGVFAIVALAPLAGGGRIRLWALAAAAAFAILALAAPALLAPLARVWLRLALALHRIVNPVVMAALFYVIVTPFGLVARLFRPGLRRRLRKDGAAPSYWIGRNAPFSSTDQQF